MTIPLLMMCATSWSANGPVITTPAYNSPATVIDTTTRLHVSTSDDGQSTQVQEVKNRDNQELHFTKRSLEISAGAEVKEIQATYTFTHVGKHPISLTGSRMTCGCLTVLPSVTTYGPGDTGTVEVIFTIGERTGLQRKAVYLTTSSTLEPEIPLSLTVQLPEGPRFDPAIVVFPQGQLSTAKIVTLTIPPNSPYRIRSAQSQNEHITAQLIPDASALEWTLSVTADVASGPLTTAIEINTEPTKKFFVFVKVEQP